MTRRLVIDGVEIGDDAPCYVIAEIGHNHQGDVAQCKRMFDVAKQAGANAVKLQKRDNRTLFTEALYNSAYENRNSYGPTYGAHREALEFGRDDYVELARHAALIGITLFATAFDIPSADFLAELDMPAFKIASGDIDNIPLLRHVARLGKPMIVSTGGAEMDAVRRAHDLIMPINRQLCLMQCTSGYPPAFEELNLRVIETFRHDFPDAVVGLSSHDSGIAMALVGYVLGARVVEKHFTLNRAAKGTDNAFSLERPGLEKLVRDLGRARLALGDGIKRRLPSEAGPLKKMGKKLVAARPLPAGHVLTAEDIAVRSPNDGLSPRFFDELIGRRLVRGVGVDENITFADLGVTVLEPA